MKASFKGTNPIIIEKRTIIPNACPVSYGRLNKVKGDKRMSDKKKDDPKEGVTSILDVIEVEHLQSSVKWRNTPLR